MPKYFFYIFILIIAVMFFSIEKAQASSQKDLFNDSFDQTEINQDKWNIQNNSDRIDQKNGYIRFKGGPEWGDASIYSKDTFERVPGRAFINNIRGSVFWASGPLAHFSPTTSPSNPTQSGYGITAESANVQGSLKGRFHAVIPGFTIPYTKSHSNNAYDPSTFKSIDYLTATVLRQNGSYHLVSGGTFGTYPVATLIWVNDAGNETNMHVGLSNRNSISFVADSKVIDLGDNFASEYGLAKAADTFSRSDSNELGNTENGSFSWVQETGQIQILDGNLVRVGDSESRTIFTANKSEGMYELFFTTPPETFSTVMTYFRYQNSDNWWRISCNTNLTQIHKKVADIQSLVFENTNLGCAQNNSYRLVVRDHDNNINAWLNNVNIVGAAGILDPDLSNEMGVGVGFSGDGVSVKVDKILAWPKQVTLPASSASFPTVPLSTSTVVVSDQFTDSDGVLLSSHTTNQGNPWVTSNNNWRISGNKATATSEGVVAATETGLTDMAVSADVTMPEAGSGMSEWFSGVVVRYKDPQNYTSARFLWQTTSPEIEIWDVINGTAYPNILTPPGFVNATNITNILAPNTTHNLKMVVVGNKISAYMDGELIVSGITSRTEGTKAGLLIDKLVTLPLSSFDNFQVNTVQPDQVPPSPVTDLSTSIYRSTYPRLNWGVPGDDTTGIKYYRVFRSTDGSLGAQVNTDNQTTTNTYDDYGVTTSGTYHYTVQPVDMAGNVNNSLNNSQASINFTYATGAPAACTPLKNTITASIQLPENVVINGSFDQQTSGYPTSWMSRPTGFWDSSVKKNGAGALRLEGPSSGSTSTYSFQNKNLVPNAKYQLKAWVKTENVNGQGIGLRYVQSASSTNIFTTQFVKGTTDWKEISLEFVTPNDHTTGRLDVLWIFNAGDKGWVDDVRLERLTYPNLAVNSSFEEANSSSVLSTWWARATGKQDKTIFKTGTASIKMTGPTNITYSQQALNLLPNTQYELSYWVKPSEILGKGLMVRYAQLTPSGIVYESTWARCNSDWQQVSRVFKTPADHQTGRLDVFWGLNTGDIGWADDVKICQRSCL